jgi:hypothetical protein
LFFAKAPRLQKLARCCSIRPACIVTISTITPSKPMFAEEQCLPAPQLQSLQSLCLQSYKRPPKLTVSFLPNDPLVQNSKAQEMQIKCRRRTTEYEEEPLLLNL